MAGHQLWRGDYHSSTATLAVDRRDHQATVWQSPNVGADQLHSQCAPVYRYHHNHLQRIDDLQSGAAGTWHRTCSWRQLAHAAHDVGKPVSGADEPARRVALAVDRQHAETAGHSAAGARAQAGWHSDNAALARQWRVGGDPRRSMKSHKIMRYLCPFMGLQDFLTG